MLLRPFLAFVLLIVATSGAFAAASYEIIDTGLLGRRDVYWIDNHQVLFAGYDVTRSVGTGARSTPQPVLYVWDSKSRQAKVHADIPESDYVCYSGGFVSYAILKEGKRYIREGKLGAETEREWIPPAPRSKIDRNELTCKEFDLSTADKIYSGFLLIPLRDGDGYYGWQKKGSTGDAENSPMFFLPAGESKEPIALPFRSAEKRRITYSEYMSAYIVERSELSRKDAGKVAGGKAWILFPTGRASEVQLPNGSWLRATWGYAPTRKGWSVSSRSTGRKSNFDPGEAGVYLVNEGVAKRLIVGFPGPPAVSPDGCRLAAVVNPFTGPGLRATVHVIELCK